ncbi:DUF6125 family protein [Chloroflexota bacterium]
MHIPNIEDLPKETIIKLARMYSRNWQSLDSLWFQNVEKTCGLETTAKIDLENWQKQAVLEAKRLRETMELNHGSLADLLTALCFMSWQLTSPRFVIEEESPKSVIFSYRQCAVQESRAKSCKPLFHCKQMKLTLLTGIASVVAPKAQIQCLAAPPYAETSEYWCRWQISLA